MKTTLENKKILGYIEGFYGRLLNWDERKLIIHSLYKNKMNTYLYAPKEDMNHRLNWRKKYSIEWRKNFRNFTHFGERKKISIIAGIAPGLDFNFKILNDNKINNYNNDFILLYKKAQQLLEDGADSIALMLDDIPNDFKNKFGDDVSEGTYHGILANTLLKKLGHNIYFVPRIYADELIKDEPFYLKDLSRVLSPKIKVFYCGKNVVSKTLTNYQKINKILPNNTIFWDNYYTNDYCPRRFFIGPFLGRQNINNIMINPTGLIKTDLLILDLFASNFNNKVSIKEWDKILKIHGVPKNFKKIKKFFSKPDFGSDPAVQSFNVTSKDFESIDFLLWKWKGPLSREWYPFIFGLKQDLQINKNQLTSERIIKTQTMPLSKFLNKGELK
jgi:hyaluronoglucosaminidase